MPWLLSVFTVQFIFWLYLRAVVARNFTCGCNHIYPERFWLEPRNADSQAPEVLPGSITRVGWLKLTIKVSLSQGKKHT